MRKYFYSIASFLVAVSLLSANANPTALRLSNSSIERTFDISEGFRTTSFLFHRTGIDYVRQNNSDEFALRINGKLLKGSADFRYLSHNTETMGDTTRLTVWLEPSPIGELDGVKLAVLYEIYEDLPLTRKRVAVFNNSGHEIVIEDLLVEKLIISAYHTWLIDTEVYSDFGTHFNKVPYRGNYSDPAVLVFHRGAFHGQKQGFIAGNEAPGVMKYVSVYETPEEVAIGLNPSDEIFPFRRYLSPGEGFESPGVFLSFFDEENPERAWETDYAQFIRRYLGVKIFEQSTVPFTIYNTWKPFTVNISDGLIRQLADALEGTGTDLFIIDDGWQNESGEWQVDSKKFPQGLTATCDYIRSKGMEVGLWFAFGNVKKDSRLVQEHPDWLIYNEHGNPTNLHGTNPDFYTMSMGSAWFDYMLGIIRQYVRECDLRYVKLDLTVVTSAYMLDYRNTGDYRFDGKTYRDHASSYYELYKRTFDFMDSLSAEFPRLLIDCTYETMGRYGLIDYSTLRHAHYDWITNYEDRRPFGPLSIRQMARDRGRVIPPVSCLIGNQPMTGDMQPYTFLSLASSQPIMIGDVRNMTPEMNSWYAGLNEWFKEMQQRYQINRFYQTSLFDRPTAHNWDGVYKFNPEKNGGVLFFYRNGSLSARQTYAVPDASPRSTYRLYSPVSGKDYGLIEGTKLLEEGIEIELAEPFSVEVIGIEPLE